MTIKELESMINSHANTNVSMRGEIDSTDHFAGILEGSSTDELYAFVKYIADTRGEAFENVNFRHGQASPPTFTCGLRFDTKDLKPRDPQQKDSKPKKGFFQRLFG